jgi:hypothetical protein
MQHVSKAELDAAWKYAAPFENVEHSVYLDNKGITPWTSDTQPTCDMSWS